MKMILELLQPILQFAEKWSFGNKILKGLIVGELILGSLLFTLLSSGLVENSINFYADSHFPTGMIPFWGLTMIHYGVGMYLYLFSGWILLLLLTILIAWLCYLWKKRKERNEKLDRMLQHYEQNQAS